MNKFFKYLIITIFLITESFSYDINERVLTQDKFANKTVYLPLNNYRILKFDKRIRNIQLTNSSNIQADFIDNKEFPLMMLKILGKEISNESAIVTFHDDKSLQINFSIMQNLDSIITLIKSAYPNLVIEQANDTVILKGYVKNYREKDQVIDIFKKAGITLEDKLVDLIQTSEPSKMIRIKLYAVEINNDTGLDLKNNWSVGYRNHTALRTSEDEYAYTRNDFYDSSIAQANASVSQAMDGILANAVTLSGGLTGAANHLGKLFNTTYVLNYLSSQGVANILDETTLITLENKESTFRAGGSLKLKANAITPEGVPVTMIETIKYGLELKIKAKNIMNDQYVDLEIDTSNTQIDWANQVDGIPSFFDKIIKTNVLAKNQSTIVLAGLINHENSNDVEKIPLLGDIPILGKLFTSKSFKEGKSELVFFITPEIVDPMENNQFELYKERKRKMLDTRKYKDEDEDQKKDEDIQKTSFENFFEPRNIFEDQ